MPPKRSKMPTQASVKRVRGVSVFRPFVFGNVARPIDSDNRPEGVPHDHSHQWTVWVKGVDDEDISYWLRKVQFKLHDSFTNSLRTIENPPFEVTETGWGEFELTIKLYFAPESCEKPQTLWHSLKIHPYGPDAELIRAEKRPIISQNYEEVIFNEPAEGFYDILTGAGAAREGNTKPVRGGKAAAASAGKSAARPASTAAVKPSPDHGAKAAEIPLRSTPQNPFSRETEGKELDRMRVAVKKVEEMIREERETLKQREAKLEELRRTEGILPKKR